MQRLKAVEAVRRSSFQRFSSFSNLKRGFSSLPNYAQTDDVFDQILVKGGPKSRAAILNRPSALNAHYFHGLWQGVLLRCRCCRA
ncbi:3-hydroxyisobutyryl-CoA hydrolase-like protein 2, mitochondrial isoform X2 [Cucurbita pepo subsp. pepo]|uniref:3-hydroxyisobutyryl-CoA hydrolase-like protein 2, mitochondrial isoform X2 n=1 Tax=Cucurbita pepo subsp. pepo TaxID=3664 RepID=UPI000C9D9521|nr:3-hydroxyisobutyryl-CoA hydrolase-like protein 2, mitochondrial isoform X2 [Cucurbita pepo subsp. pepo]